MNNRPTAEVANGALPQLVPESAPLRRHLLLMAAACVAAWPALAADDAGSAAATGAMRKEKTAEQGPDGLTDAELADALQRLQQAVAAQDAQGVAALVAFPLRVNQANPGRQVKRDSRWTRARFLADYAQLFDDKMRQIIAAQTTQTLFRSSRGAMLGNGELWLSGVCQDNACRQRKVQVVALNRS